jgi:hypothetical protein
MEPIIHPVVSLATTMESEDLNGFAVEQSETSSSHLIGHLARILIVERKKIGNTRITKQLWRFHSSIASRLGGTR